jgi:menaquinone-9 beta-reductase
MTHPGIAAEAWDAVVIGAGPAGAIAARQLSLLGHHVLLIERSTFPRHKVCGGCVNARAMSALSSIGLSELLSRIDAPPLQAIRVHVGRQIVEYELPEGKAVSRWSLDAALAERAATAGATLVTGTTARVGQLTSCGGYRLATLQAPGRSKPTIVQAKMVIAADGLQHPSLAEHPAFQSRVHAGSHVGLGAILADDQGDLQPGRVQMAVGAEGYVGMVRVENGQLNVAAAVRPTFLKRMGSPAKSIGVILREASLPCCTAVERAAWHGTPAVTRCSPQVADERLLLIGDAAGYVEPFTGEGIAWAIESALLASLLAANCIGGRARPVEIAHEWSRQYASQLKRRQTICRMISWTLGSPLRVQLILALSRWLPGVTSRALRRINEPLSPLLPSLIASQGRQT